MLFLYESRTIYRQVFTDGRPLPPADVQPTWMGYSVGRWEGDTFVVESNGFDDRTWLTTQGHQHSARMRLVERFRRVAADTLEVSLTIDDPDTYTKPWKVNLSWSLVPDVDLIESICEENNKAAHLDTIEQ